MKNKRTDLFLSSSLQSCCHFLCTLVAKNSALLITKNSALSLTDYRQAAIVFPEGVLFQTNNAFKQVKQDLLENFNVHTIVSLPAGVFLPYSGVKTNIVFFTRNGSTRNIWYYEVNPPAKLTKNKPIQPEHFNEFLQLYHAPDQRGKVSANEWTVNITDIKEYDLSAKNPHRQVDEDHLPPLELMEHIRSNEQSITALIEEIEELLGNQQLEQY